jgi:hypothetical protein
MRTKLGSLLDQYDEARRAVELRKQQLKREETDFQEQFQALCRKVIRPVFESAGELLRARGHEFMIDEQPYAAQPGGKTQEASITMRIVPAGVDVPKQADGHLWSLSFTTRHYNRSVWMNGGAALSAGGATGSNASFQLSQIDTDLVEGQVLALIAGIVKG